jgi:integrase
MAAVPAARRSSQNARSQRGRGQKAPTGHRLGRHVRRAPLELYWDRDDKLCVDLSGRRPMLRIPAALEKGNKDRLLPMAPDFAELLLSVPESERTGPVFAPGTRRHSDRLSDVTVGRTVSEIGKAAGVKVNTAKFASAHDLRRSFGERWASRVMPQVLMELMRHESIDTTMKFYVGRNAYKTADALWESHAEKSSTLSSTCPSEASGSVLSSALSDDFATG